MGVQISQRIREIIYRLNNLSPVRLILLFMFYSVHVSSLHIGCTIRTVRTRISEHRRFIKKGCDKHSVPRHFLQTHNKDIKCLKVFAIEAIPIGTLTIKERFSLHFRRETFWIYMMGSLLPRGLNKELDIHTIM